MLRQTYRAVIINLLENQLSVDKRCFRLTNEIPEILWCVVTFWKLDQTGIS